jgi:ABC-2 type transport system permease protein
VSRGSIAAAKFAALAAWGALLTLAVLASATAVGLAAGLDSLAEAGLPGGLVRLGVAGMLTVLLSTTIGFVASAGRGYLPAIGAIVLLTAAAQVAVVFGTGGWFPYAAPGLYAVADDTIRVQAAQLLLVPPAALAVAWATVRWWQTAEVD